MDVEIEHLNKKPRVEFESYKEPKLECILEFGQEIHERELTPSEQFIHIARQVRAQQELSKHNIQDPHGVETQASQLQAHVTTGTLPEKREPNAEQLLILARLEVEHIIHTITMIQENYLQLNHYQAPKPNDPTQTLLLMGHKQAALTRAANRLHDKSNSLLEQSLVDHTSYWDILLGLRSKWHLRASARSPRVVVDHSNNTIGPLWGSAEGTDTPISLTEDDTIPLCCEGDLFVSVPFRPSWTGSLTNLAARHGTYKSSIGLNEESIEKHMPLLYKYNALLTQKHTQHVCYEIFQQLLGEVSGEGTKATEGTVHIDSASTDSGAHLIIRKNSSELKADIAEHTLPYIFAIMARTLLLMRYKYSTPILHSVVSLFHHVESLAALTEKLEALAIRTALQMHWKPSFITTSQSQFQYIILHSVCHVQDERNGDTTKGPLVVHLEGSNIYCVTTNPVHTVPLSTPAELEQFILSHMALSNNT